MSLGPRTMPPDLSTSSHAVDITTEELQRRLKDPRFTLVNVLPREAFEATRIPGSINIPVADIRERAPEIFLDRSAEIAVHCGGPT